MHLYISSPVQLSPSLSMPPLSSLPLFPLSLSFTYLPATPLHLYSKKSQGTQRYPAYAYLILHTFILHQLQQKTPEACPRHPPRPLLFPVAVHWLSNTCVNRCEVHKLLARSARGMPKQMDSRLAINRLSRP